MAAATKQKKVIQNGNATRSSEVVTTIDKFRHGEKKYFLLVRIAQDRSLLLRDITCGKND